MKTTAIIESAAAWERERLFLHFLLLAIGIAGIVLLPFIFTVLDSVFVSVIRWIFFGMTLYPWFRVLIKHCNLSLLEILTDAQRLVIKKNKITLLDSEWGNISSIKFLTTHDVVSEIEFNYFAQNQSRVLNLALDGFLPEDIQKVVEAIQWA